MSTSDTTEEASLSDIPQVGEVRQRTLRDAGCETVRDVAEVDATELFDQTTGISASEIETIVENARELVGDDTPAEVETTEAGTPVKYVPDDGDDDEPETVDADAFLDGISDPDEEGERMNPADCENVAILAGDDAFDVDGPYGELTPEGQAQLVASQLMAFGFEPEKVSTVSSGMGSQAVRSWVSYSINEGIDIPDLVEPFAADFDAHDNAADAFRERNDELMEWADGICVVANGDYVGMWVNMANDNDVLIQTPDRDEDDE